VTQPPPDLRAQALLRVVADAFELGEHDARWSRRLNLSRFHFQRMFMRYLGESPGELRRRLLLERAAHALHTSDRSITHIAFDAGYDSLEGFSRAFRRAYGISPSHYRRIPLPRAHVPAASNIHYDPATRAPRAIAALKGADDMDLTDRLIDHDAWLTRLLLERAAKLSDEQLDAQRDTDIVPFECPRELTLREALHRMVFTKEVWVAAVRKKPIGDGEFDKSIPAMLKRLDRAYLEFAEVVRQVRDEGRWDEEFEDALCEPPERFTFGGMIAHVITFAAFRRCVVIRIMNELGITDIGYGDPIEWERSLATAKA
jgi:AraC-like DNA-binding protein